MAGGVAQNCLMNQAICQSGLFENVFIQPLAGDVGGSVGAALYRYHAVWQKPRRYVMRHLYLGPSYELQLDAAARQFGLQSRPSSAWETDTAQAIADGLIVGYFNGRMEAGPRALGARSILADARRADMKDLLNSRVKHREHFRPFAPSVLEEHVNTVFEPLPACRSLDYMITTMSVRSDWRLRVPAVSHNDGTARVQAVRREYAPDFHAIISRFHQLTGVPLVINTSFNDNEPIVWYAGGRDPLFPSHQDRPARARPAAVLSGRQRGPDGRCQGGGRGTRRQRGCMMRRTKAMSGPRILVNVPILNEIENIEALVTGVMQALDGRDYVLLIVDDGSTDGTLDTSS